jgi:hypothetical protein
LTHGYKRNGTDTLFATPNAANGEVFGLYQERGFRRRAGKTLSQQVKVAHPLMLRAIAAAKKKNDQIDASKIAGCLRCGFLLECPWQGPRFAIDAEPCATRTCWCARSADEESDFGSADGSRSELQQAEAAQSGLLFWKGT